MHAIKAMLISKPKILLSILTLGVAGIAILYFTHPSDSSDMDASALPQVPAGFEAQLFAKEPLVGNPSAMAFVVAWLLAGKPATQTSIATH